MSNGLMLEGGQYAVLLLHGLYSNAMELQYLAKRLHGAGYSVRVPHLPGYSVLSANYSRTHGSCEHWLEAAEAELDGLLEKFEQVSLGGLCIGADLALMLAAKKGPRISALMLLSTTLYYDGWALPWYKFLLPLAYYTPLGRLYAYEEREPYGLKNEQMRRLVSAQMRQMGVSSVGASRLRSAGLYQAQRLIRAVKKCLPEVAQPTLIVHATEDDMTSLKSVRCLEKNLASTEVECLLLGNSYHMVSLDNDRSLVAERMIAFLQAHSG